MDILKIFLSVVGVCLPGLSILIGGWFFINWNVICSEDIIRIPKRMIREIVMNEKDKAKIIYKECTKLREFILTLDIPIEEKRSFLWRIQSMEEDSVKKLTKEIVKENLEDLKKE